MSSDQQIYTDEKGANAGGPEGSSSDNGLHGSHSPLTAQMTHEEREVATAAARFGYGPLAKVSSGNRLPAFGGEFQPGLYRPVENRQFANPAPLGLCAFAATTFVLSLINLNTQGVSTPNMVCAISFAYGGLVQLLSGMWEMATGNTFAATALSSYGGFWIALGIILTPGFQMEELLGTRDFNISFGFFLLAWFIFTTLLTVCTVKSTVAFFCLFFFLDLTFLVLGVGHLLTPDEPPHAPPVAWAKAGGVFGLLSAFSAWYVAFAGIADDSNSFFIVPVLHFPWSAEGRQASKEEKSNV